ncbi:MAG TPA: cytochrome c biogenesis protein CcdA [Fibrobacteria bacterium]|nr:cytochrome c biogenesis protein CcdA [Fibrobacteria bacterium]
MNNLDTALSTGSAGVLFLCFAAGVASSFTPCIYPLIPVTIGILGSNQAESKLKGFLLTLVYVGGIAFTYATLGLVAAFTGSLFGSFSSNPWLLLGISVVIMALALNMLDVFQIRFIGISGGAGGSRKPGFASNFAYGLTFGLIASPCTAPPLAAILTWVGSTRSLVLGPLFLFSFAMGMGSILLLLGTFSTFLSRIPKSGMWMVVVKKAMGYLMIVMAGYFTFKAGTQW